MSKSLVEGSAVSFLRESLSWRYYSGSHFLDVKHPESGWRLLPFLVVVCPTEGRYFSAIEKVGRIVIEAGEVLLVPAGIRHTVAMPEGGVLHDASIQFTFFGSIDALSFFEVPYHVGGKQAGAIAEAAKDLHIACRTPGRKQMQPVRLAIWQNELGGRLLSLIASVSELNQERFSRVGDMTRLEPALRYLESHLSEPVRCRELAKMTSLSETRFQHVFKEAMGLSPMRYMRNIRIRKAQELLCQSDMQIAEAGAAAGYPDIFHFSKVFKTACGISPSVYRKEARLWKPGR